MLSKEVNSSLFVTALIVDVTKRCFWVTMCTDTTEPYPAGEVDDDVEPGLGPANGGLRGSRELQGGRMLIIKRPQVAKFMFIWAARRKSFPVKRNGDQRNIYTQYTKRHASSKNRKTSYRLIHPLF